MSEFEGEVDISSMKVADLKKELKKRGLSMEGKKQELIERLLLDDSRNKSGGEEFLGDEEADKLLKEEDETHEKSALDEEEEETLNSEPPKKKVAINRDITIPTQLGVTSTQEEDNQKESTSASPTDHTKMNDEDKSNARKERFGIETPSSTDDQKSVRAARFGIEEASTPVDMDKLKQRSERFGQVDSSAIKKMEDAERIKKRQERFGVVTAEFPVKKISTGVIDHANDEKLKKRAERFGAAPGSSDVDEKKKLRSMRFGVAAS
uniref:SAP domain-containing ribonucleoprotein n=1 Tax=Lepeophtheirus salmonis TaxID=72036 RepID=D3PGB3_LEPSM|nr:SAP domain-containing ribonucleoprotein [Lepeophtheirus salmonis]